MVEYSERGKYVDDLSLLQKSFEIQGWKNKSNSIQ